MLSRYRICAESADVQASERLDSDIVGSLSYGEEIEVLETTLLQKELEVRLRFSGGWISLSTSEGVPIAEVVESIDIVPDATQDATPSKRKRNSRAPELDAIEQVDERPTITELATLLRAAVARRKPSKREPDEDTSEDIPRVSTARRFANRAADKFVRTRGRCGVFATRRPACTLCLGFIVVCLLILLGALTAPIGVETDLNDFLTADVDASIMYDIYKEAGTAQYGNSRRLEEANIFIVKDIAVVYQIAKSGLQHGVLHDVPIAEIATIESKLRGLSGWKRLCNTVYTSSQSFCDPGISYVNYLNSGDNAYLLNFTGDGSPIAPASAFLAIADAGLEDLIFGLDFDPDASPYQATELRSVWRFKIPCCHNTESLWTRQMKARLVHSDWEDFLSEELLPTLRTTVQNLEEDEESTIVMSYQGSGFLAQEIIRALYHDMVFAVISFVFVLGYMFFHTRSPILSLVGLFIALLSLPLSYFICAIFGADAISFASFLAVFLLVGFTCDVIFIYSDYWHKSDTEFRFKNLDPTLELHFRPIWAVQKGLHASGPTMFTTAISFFANATSPFRALRQFGVFVGLCVILAWALLTLAFPSMYVLDHRLRTSSCWLKLCFFAERRCPTKVTWKAYAAHMRRLRWCYFFVPLLGSLTFAGLLVPMTTWNTDDVGILPSDNPVGRMDLVEADLFASRSIPSTAPDTTATLCSFEDDASSTCLYATCPDGYSQGSWNTTKVSIGVGNMRCPCYRYYLNENCSSAPSVAAATARVFVDSAPNSTVREQIETEIDDYWSHYNWGYAFPGFNSLVTLTLMLTEWTTGEQTTLYAVDVEGRANKSATTVEACGYTDMCFCSSHACDMTSKTGWGSIVGLWVEAASLSRRLSSHSSEARNRPSTVKHPRSNSSSSELESQSESSKSGSISDFASGLDFPTGSGPGPGAGSGLGDAKKGHDDDDKGGNISGQPLADLDCEQGKGNTHDGKDPDESSKKAKDVSRNAKKGREQGAAMMINSKRALEANSSSSWPRRQHRKANVTEQAKDKAMARAKSQNHVGGILESALGTDFGEDLQRLDGEILSSDEPWRWFWDRFHPAADARRLASTPRTLVVVVLGLKINTAVPALAALDLENAWAFDPDVDFADPWTQRNAYSMCQAIISNSNELKISDRTCWMNNFYYCQKQLGRRFPSSPETFHSEALDCGAATSYTLWLSGDKVMAMAAVNVVAYSTSQSLETLKSYRKKWENMLDEEPSYQNPNSFMVSPLWVQIEKQEAILVGTGLTMSILLVVTLAIMMLFTKSWVLSLYVCLATIIALAYLLGFCVVILGWEMGLIQAVALIYFVGYGVTFPLHVAHLYALPLNTPPVVPTRRREAFFRLLRTQASLEGIGGASVGSAITTAGASFFLIFCSLTVFQDLGAMCLIVTVFSLFVALVPLPAALLAFGPTNLTGKITWCCCRRPTCRCSCKRRRKMDPPPDPNGDADLPKPVGTESSAQSL